MSAVSVAKPLAGRSSSPLICELMQGRNLMVAVSVESLSAASHILLYTGEHTQERDHMNVAYVSEPSVKNCS